MDSDCLRAVQVQGNTVQKKGNTVILYWIIFFDSITFFMYMYIINW